MMSLERIYELIRKEEVVLFCGAGMSIYAGYPSGQQFANMVYADLSTEENGEIPPNLALPDLTDQVVDLRMGRNSIIQLVKTVFGKTPSDTRLHQDLAKIPHIKTIITTNYDLLFEKAYNSNCSVIRSNADLAYMDKTKPEIFKIHGDIQTPDHILISKTDYTKFFDSPTEEVLWTVIKERIATRHVLFIGYSLDDINMDSIFRKLIEHLGDHHKEIFLLAPDLKQPKQQRLIKGNIKYIDSKADIFITGLYENTLHNIYEDFDRNWCSPETFRKFCQINNLSPTIKGDKEKYTVVKMEPLGNKLSGRLTFDAVPEGNEAIQKFGRLIDSEEIGSVTLDDQVVKNLAIYINGIRIPNKDGGPMTFESVPQITTMIDISFDGGGEYEQIPVEVFRTKTYILFVLKFPNVDLRLQMPPGFTGKLQYQIQVKRHGQYGRLSDELRTTYFLNDLGSGKKITVFVKGASPTTFDATDTAPLKDFAQKYIYYFERLKKVETHYKIKFNEIGEITQDGYNMLNLIIDHIEGKPFIGIFTDAWVFKPGDTTKALNFVESLKPDFTIGRTSEHPENFLIHGKELLMGYRNTQLLEPYVENLEEFKKDPSQLISIKSRSESIAITFTPTIEKNTPQEEKAPSVIDPKDD